jgi:hypothetical protein
VFGIPLPGGYALGVAARLAPRGGVLGYFFFCSHGLRAESADAIGMFGDPYLLDGTWPVLGHLPDWDRSKWPVPSFAHQDVVSGAWFLRFYDDKLRFVDEKRTTAEAAAKHPEDGDMGCEAARRWLAKLAPERHAKLLAQLPQLAPVAPHPKKPRQPRTSSTSTPPAPPLPRAAEGS